VTHRLSDFEQRLLSIHVLSRASRQIVLRRRGEGVTVKEVDLMFPISSKPRETVDFRVRKAEASLWWFRRLAPGADSVYPLRDEELRKCLVAKAGC
jgi:hypothetical protein